MTENANKPSIRFKGFTDAWEQRKVKNIAETTYGGGTPSTANNALWEGAIPWIQSSDLTEHDVLNVSVKKHISDKAIKQTATKLVPQDSIAIITRVGVGKVAYMPFSYTTSQDFVSLSKLKVNALFAVYSLYLRLQKDMSIVQGTSIKGITKEELLDKSIGVPNMESEQTQIGVIFKQLDNLITLHQRKYDKLVNVKKSLLEKMFPSGDERVPKIRFKGFTEAWEQRKLGEYFDERTERSAEGELISVTISSGIKKFSELNRHDTTPEDMSHYKVVCKGDIAYNSMRMWQGASGYSPYNGILSPAYTVITPKNNVSSRFFAYLLKLPYMIHLFGVHSQGLTKDTWNLKFPAFSEIECCAPIDVIEQDIIARTLEQLDNLITLHQRKLEKLKNIKKSLLEKMFV